MKQYLLDRLKEPSTIRGLIWLISAFGIYEFNDNQEQALVAMAMALAGAGGLLPDHLSALPRRPAASGDNRPSRHASGRVKPGGDL